MSLIRLADKMAERNGISRTAVVRLALASSLEDPRGFFAEYRLMPSDYDPRESEWVHVSDLGYSLIEDAVCDDEGEPIGTREVWMRPKVSKNGKTVYVSDDEGEEEVTVWD